MLFEENVCVNCNCYFVKFVIMRSLLYVWYLYFVDVKNWILFIIIFILNSGDLCKLKMYLILNEYKFRKYVCFF